jgi:ribose-phosphate pyrophosphokinase
VTPLGELRLFAGTSHPELALELAKYLGIQLGKIKISRFSGGEIYTRVEENIRGQNIYVLQTCTERVNEELMELFVMLDAFRRASAESITVVIPHFGYARQDKKSASREPISARLVADLLTTAGATRVITSDLHADQIQGFFTAPLDHLTAMPLICNYFAAKKIKDLAIVAPDVGRARVAKKMADRLHADLAILHKRRPNHQEAEITHVVGEVKGKTCVVVDDMIDTGGTIIRAVETLLQSGANPEIYAAATHGIFSGKALKSFSTSSLKEIVVCNTLPFPKERRFPALTVISAAPLFGEAILRSFERRSISSLFD